MPYFRRHPPCGVSSKPAKRPSHSIDDVDGCAGQVPTRESDALHTTLVPNDVFFFSACWCGLMRDPFSTVVRMLVGCAFGFLQLSNGVRVASQGGNGPLASLSLSVDVGTRYESVDNNGTCAVLAAAAFKVG